MDNQQTDYLQNRYTELLEKFQWDHTGILNSFIKQYKEEKILFIWTEQILKEYTELVKKRKSKLERTKNQIDSIMTTQKTDKFDSKYWKLSYRKSQSVNVFDENKLSDEYKVIKEVSSIDKMKIKDDINAGKIVEWAEIIENNNLQVK